MLGVKQLIVGINKMDVSGFNQQKYETLKTELTALLKQLGFKLDNVPFVPYSALEGSNFGQDQVGQDDMVHRSVR